jgi:nucleoside-diphosphate-sugar epimerase
MARYWSATERSVRVLVTGSTGFIGRSLAPRLVSEGFRVRCAVRVPSTVPAGAEISVVGDIGKHPQWGAALQGVDAIVHLAGIAHHKARTEAYGVVNVDGTRLLAEAAINAGVGRLIFVSSIAVNGDVSPQRPLREDDAPRPTSAYGLSKQYAEQDLIEAASGRGMGWCIVRPPLVYGPGASGNFQRLMQLIARGWPLPLGAATAKRSFIALDNLISVLITVLQAPRAHNQLFLASDGEDVSTADFVRCLARHMGVDIRLIAASPRLVRAAAALLGRPGDASKLFDPLQIDSSRLCESLSWRPVVTLDEGLRRAVAVKVPMARIEKLSGAGAW